MPVIACKLPNGLQITHEGQTIVLVGSNIGERLENVSPNGRLDDNNHRSGGFGLTEVSDRQADAFAAWAKAVTMDENGGKLAEPFPALENGSILGPYKSFDEARKECTAMSDAVATGFEGLDPEKEGVEKNDDADEANGAAPKGKRGK